MDDEYPSPSTAYKPALLVVDVQEDFCPPDGTLAVPDARAILPTVNALLALPFPLKLATQDWHPATHVSFAANHGPNVQPYTSTHTIHHPTDPRLSYGTTLWPAHCVQDTPGAALLPALRADLLHGVIKKGKREDVEMYSAFYDPFQLEDSGLAGRLRREGVTHVFVVGLAADYCVRSSAVDAAREGFITFVVEEGTRAVDPVQWDGLKADLEDSQEVRVISMDSPEVERVRSLAPAAA